MLSGHVRKKVTFGVQQEGTNLTSLSEKYYHTIKNFDHVIKSFRYGSMPRVPNQHHGGPDWFVFFPWVLCQGCRDGLVCLIYGIFIVFFKAEPVHHYASTRYYKAGNRYYGR